MQLQADLVREWDEMPPMSFTLDRLTVTTIVGALQLALRHPQLAETHGAAPVIREFIRLVSEAAGPAMRAAILLGYAPEQDL
jgi:hypothetical protein